MSIFLGLVDSLGREPRAAEYRRQVIQLIARDSGYFNEHEVTFPQAVQSWGAVSQLRLYDNGGDEICTVRLSVPQHVTPDTTLSLGPHTLRIDIESDIWEHLTEELEFDERQLCLKDVAEQSAAPAPKKKSDPDIWDMILSDDQVV